jgi:glycogenin glucosyltransferase
MGAEPPAIVAGHVPEAIDARDKTALLAFAERLDRTATAWLDGLGAAARRDGRRVFYLVVATAEYAPGVAALVASLRAVSDLPILVLAAGGWKPDLAVDRLAVVAVPEIVKHDLEGSLAPRFRRTLTKLWAFSFVSTDRLAYLDGDCLVQAPIDDLLDGTGFAAAPDLLCNQPEPVFNSGVLALSPDVATRQALFEGLSAIPSFDGGDQGILNAFLGAPATWLPSRDNYLRTYEFIMPGAARTARIVHFTAKKPWSARAEQAGDRTLIDLDDAWTAQLDRDGLMALIGQWRRDTAATEIAADATLRRLEAQIKLERRRTRRAIVALAVLTLLQTALLWIWLAPG